MTTTKTIPAGVTKSTPVMLDAEKFVFKGTGPTIEAYKAAVLKHQNDIGSIRAYTYGTYHVSFDGIILVVPKSWVIIL